MSSPPENEDLSTVQAQLVDAAQTALVTTAPPASTPVTNDDEANQAPAVGFLDLPIEIQQMIFRLLLIKDIYRDSNTIGRRFCPSVDASAGLLRVCRQFHAVGQPILLGENIIDLYHGSVLKIFFGTIGRSNIPLINHVKLDMRAINMTRYRELKRCKGLQRLIIRLPGGQKLHPSYGPGVKALEDAWSAVDYKESVGFNMSCLLNDLNIAKVVFEADYRLDCKPHAKRSEKRYENIRATVRLIPTEIPRLRYDLKFEGIVRLKE